MHVEKHVELNQKPLLASIMSKRDICNSSGTVLAIKLKFLGNVELDKNTLFDSVCICQNLFVSFHFLSLYSISVVFYIYDEQ
jgi:hypothetical protein